MDLDINRVAVTRDGRRYKLLMLDRPAKYPVVGYNLDNSALSVWMETGRSSQHGESSLDIVGQEPFDVPQAPRPKIDIKKPVKTRDGQEATIITTDGRASYKGEPFPLMGYIGGGTDLRMWTDTGRNPITPDADLVQESEVWVVVHANGSKAIFDSRVASQCVSRPPLARIRVPYVIGQFD